MKRILTILVAVLITASVFAQAPQKMSYQAVIRDASDQLITNQNIGMQISILQGSVTGTPVYVERQFPTTNTNGLVTIEIGSGTIVSGNFSTIDWTNGPYFIKTETDLNGGANYTITGTSQLLSVPYAFHAATADSVTGNLNETDPVFTSSQANNITATDITNLSNLSGTNTGDQTISRTGLTVTLSNGGGSYQDSVNTYTAGDGIDIVGTVISEHKYQVGDSAQGGIIFWVDETGEHGLVAATSDQSTGVRWYAGTYGSTRATGDGLYAGEANTAIIISSQVSIGDDGSDYAAQLCANYQGGGYGDWYLPSKYELNLLYQQKNVVGGFASAYYWSSTEVDSGYAWIQNFYNSNQLNGSKGVASYRVRAVRAF